jgi:hypothetical protein
MSAEHGKAGLSEIEQLALESTEYLNNVREAGGNKVWAYDLGCFLVRATSVLGWMGREELVAQVYLNMGKDLNILLNNPELAKAFVSGAIGTTQLLGSEYKLRHQDLFSKKPESQE